MKFLDLESGRLSEAERLLTFYAFRMGAYSRWALIRAWALIRINTVYTKVGERSGSTDPPKENGRKFAPSPEPRLPLKDSDTAETQITHTRGRRQSLAPEKENNGSKRLSPTPSVSNLSLRPCRYLSTVTRSSSRGSVEAR